MIQAISSDDLAPSTYAWHVRAENLAVRAGRRLAVAGVDLSFTTGVYGVLGPNGAGKTTLLRALATVRQPAAGRLDLLGAPMHERGGLPEVRRQLGYLPQTFGYYRWYTVREFVEYLAWLKAVPGQDLAAEVQRAIDLVGLSGHADHRLRTLSGGMVRRAGLAQAIVGDPALLVLDEPTAGLDPQSRAEIRELLSGLGRTNCVVMATHLVEDVADDSTEIVILDDGHLAFRGTPAQVAAAAAEAAPGNGSELERGYAVLLERSRLVTR